jgi:broad specificity phosphatase PhoE
MSDARTPLSDIGWQQAEKTGAGLRDHLDLPDIVYHSDYLRTQQTYEGICRGWPELKNVKKSIDSRIREQEHGLLTLFNDKWLYFAYNPQDALLYRKDGKFYFRFANGENKHDVLTRVWQFYSKLIRDHSGQKVLVIAHHITILAHRANQENWSAEQFLAADENERPSNCGVSTYEGDLAASPEKGGKLVLKEYNRVYY